MRISAPEQRTARTLTGAGRITPRLSTGAPTPAPTEIVEPITNTEATLSQRSILSTAPPSTASEVIALPAARMSALPLTQITASPMARGSPIPLRSTDERLAEIGKRR